jgi:hypothetical protein
LLYRDILLPEFAIFGLYIVVAIKPIIIVDMSWGGTYNFSCGATTQLGTDCFIVVAVSRLHAIGHTHTHPVALL